MFRFLLLVLSLDFSNCRYHRISIAAVTNSFIGLHEDKFFVNQLFSKSMCIFQSFVSLSHLVDN